MSVFILLCKYCSIELTELGTETVYTYNLFSIYLNSMLAGDGGQRRGAMPSALTELRTRGQCLGQGCGNSRKHYSLGTPSSYAMQNIAEYTHSDNIWSNIRRNSLEICMLGTAKVMNKVP